MITTRCDPKKVMLELLGTPVSDEGGWNAHELVADNYRSFFVECKSRRVGNISGAALFLYALILYI